MIYAKQSTARTVTLGPFLAKSDGATQTALSLTQAKVRLSKNGGAFAQKNNATTASHMENGYYSVPLDETDFGTLGNLLISVTETGVWPVWEQVIVLPAAIYDAWVAGTETLEANVTEMNGGVTAAIVADVWSEALPGDFTTGQAGKLVGDNVNATISSRATQTSVDTIDDFLDIEIAAILAAVDTEVAAIKAKTDNLPASPAAVGSAMTLATGAITAAVIATNAIDADALAADAVTEIQNGLATQASVAAIDDYVDTEIAAIKAKTDLIPAQPAAVGSAMTLHADYDAAKTAASQASVTAIDDYVDTEIAAIKAKTDLIPAQPAAVGSAMMLASGAITAAVIASNAIDADALAADAVAEIQSGLSTQASVDALPDAAAITTAVQTMLTSVTLPDSYPTPGNLPTFTQALLALNQFMTERGISGQYINVYKPDGSTLAFRLLMDSATAPTSVSLETNP